MGEDGHDGGERLQVRVGATNHPKRTSYKGGAGYERPSAAGRRKIHARPTLVSA